MTKAKMRRDWTGEVHGRLTVIEQAEDYVKPKGQQRAKLRCRCSCAAQTIVEVVAMHLTDGNTTSCGCYQREVTSIDEGQVAIRAIERNYRGSARKRKLEYILPHDVFLSLIRGRCLWCNSIGSNKFRRSSGNTSEARKDATARDYQGIDRLHNHIGYTPDNCVSCCMVCNLGKHKMPLTAWMDWHKLAMPHRRAIALAEVIRLRGPNWAEEVASDAVVAS